VKSGANIAFPERAKAAEHEHLLLDEIAPIIQDKCVACHQEGGIAPFAMDSYDVVKSMAPMIRRVGRVGTHASLLRRSAHRQIPERPRHDGRRTRR
jgi:hypothetical protein